VSPTPAARAERGRLVISIDLEVAWGTCDRAMTARRRRALERERDIVERVLALFARYDVRASWAVVGHLLLPRCDARDGRFHPEIPRPILRGERRDWFAPHPPGGTDPLWHGRDLVERILAATPAQEIASHSFSHIPYAEDRTTPEAVRADLAAARRCHLAMGLPFTAFVFPRNVVGYRPLLAEAGITVYRGRPGGRPSPIRSRRLRRLAAFLYFIAPVSARVVDAGMDDAGLVNVPQSMALYTRTGLRNLVASRSLVRKATRALDRAAAEGRLFHLWFHPSNLARRTEAQLGVLEGILRHAARLREAGRLEVRSLGDVCASVMRTEARR
jgi:peptidoglycan/xylan/chitin deacetylase (PgdA/CDA1 family)